MESNTKNKAKTSFLFGDPDFSDFTLRIIVNTVENNAQKTRGRGKRKRNDANVHKNEDAEIIEVSKVVLAIRSNYFRTMFKSGMKEQQESEAKIEFESELEKTTFKQFIRFIYTKEIADDTDVLTFLKLADRFDYYGAIASVTEKMPTNLTIEQCCEWLDMLILYKDKQEIQDAINKIKQSLVIHFHKLDMRKENEALRLLPQVTSKNAVILLLGSDLLTPSSEDTIFRAAYIWYTLHRTQAKALCELSSVFRWHHMSFDFLRCISLLPEMNDSTLVRGVIDGLHSYASKKRSPNTRKVEESTSTVQKFSITWLKDWAFNGGGYRYKIGASVQNKQLTLTIKKFWPSVGECTFPLERLEVDEDGTTKTYQLKNVLLKDQEEASIVMHPLRDNNEEKLNFRLTFRSFTDV